MNQGLKENAKNQGLYTPSLEKDSCGVGLIAQLNNKPSHDIVTKAVTMLENMDHRGATGYEQNTGDGSGILTQIPHLFFAREAAKLGFELPEPGQYAVGVIFFPAEESMKKECRILFDDFLDELGLTLIGYRKVPTNNASLGHSAIQTEPHTEQVFVKPAQPMSKETFEKKLFILRKYATHSIRKVFPSLFEHFYLTSFSSSIIIYKGQLTTHQLNNYFPDLKDPLFKSALAIVHSRFSTNTFPKWKLAQPFRYIAHNGEINTIMGNINWWKAKESSLMAGIFTEEELQKIKPICGEGLSDSGSFDNILEFMILSGKSLPQALMMMIPEAWQGNPQIPAHKKAFYEFNRVLMEPWDGPAALCFTDGKNIGAMLDRNGLRPLRYQISDDNLLVIASEAGVVACPPEKVIKKGRLQPGKMLLADLTQGKIIEDADLKSAICHQKPYQQWLDDNRIYFRDLPAPSNEPNRVKGANLWNKQKLFGYTKEDLKFILAGFIAQGKDPIGSMGADIPLAVLSNHSQHLANYFKQLFAQVTNPPIDPIRERSVMSLFTMLGKRGNLMEEKAEQAQFIHLDQPILRDREVLQLRQLHHPNFKASTIDILFPADGQKGRLKAAISHICATAEDFVRKGYNIIILSDKRNNGQFAPIPSLMAVGAIHHHLIREGLRNETSIVIEGGDIRETHHLATLIGYGANAVNPYVSFATLLELNQKGILFQSYDIDALIDRSIKAMGKGLLKIFSKIGISTLQSYHGAQIFEALGLNREVVDLCFTGTVSRIEGVGFDEIAEEVLIRHRQVFGTGNLKTSSLEDGGVYQWKHRGEYHLFNPKTIHLLQKATRNNDYKSYQQFADAINNQLERACTLRGLLTFRKGKPIPIEEVEPIEHILKRFVSGAMSFGSLSHEAHSTLAIAMNRIGGKSNSGEGGEDEIRFLPKENGDSENSATKQVASGRFGVTINYLTNAKELQIKMAQGAKPGEGGQLPGHKVDNWIARVRNSTPGVGLISPPPHHDIYSIEDLAQLIFDLKNANRRARINVKLVSKAGVGIIASGVTKAKADAILISGHDGGTGASPLTSIRHAGLPWELGLAETQQTLVKNKLRDRVTVQVDGQIRTGRDIAIATLLGAEEWGVATAALVVEGCIMMRKCHLNTCPVGVATQDPELRKRFSGKADHLVNYFTFLAEDLRGIMAKLGFRTVNEMVGQVEMLKVKKDIQHWKYKHLDFNAILYKEASDPHINLHKVIEQEHGLEKALDWALLETAQPALQKLAIVKESFTIANTDRAVGTILSNEIAIKFGAQGLPHDTINYHFRGSAGQSFAAFGAKGLSFRLEGEANDYFGKGLSGARLVVVPDRLSTFRASQQIIIGNVAFYGATSGEAYIRGMAGERFCVRNSGVTAVVEGVGDHGCEYMTGGRVIVLGKTGKNFAAGMSGGIAYVFDPKGVFNNHCNQEMVDLEMLTEEDDNFLRNLIRNHHQFTESNTALNILLHWNEQIKHFVKVMPRDYKRVLNQAQQENATTIKEARA